MMATQEYDPQHLYTYEELKKEGWKAGCRFHDQTAAEIVLKYTQEHITEEPLTLKRVEVTDSRPEKPGEWTICYQPSEDDLNKWSQVSDWIDKGMIAALADTLKQHNPYHPLVKG